MDVSVMVIQNLLGVPITPGRLTPEFWSSEVSMKCCENRFFPSTKLFVMLLGNSVT